jgi:phage shock protein PspC (stress-responsive transcriptional regulator)
MVTMTEERIATTNGHPRLYRDQEGRVLAGVCTGLGRHIGIDPVVLRVAFVILLLAQGQGQGLWLYVAAALFMPGAPGEVAPAERLFRRRFDAAGVLSILGAMLCVSVVFSLIGGWVSTDTIAVLTVFGMVLLVTHARGVDLMAAVRALPERIQGHRAEPAEPAPRTGAAAAVSTPRRSSALTPVTLLAALAVGAAMVPVAAGYPSPDSSLIVAASALGVVGLGLVASGWFRARGLATVGTVLTFALLTTSVAGEAPRDARYGDVEWRPVDTPRVEHNYKVGVGSGKLDLTAVRFVPGQRVSVTAEVMFGELKVTVPRTARVELDARVGLGDLEVDGRTVGGPRARSTEVLEPEDANVKNPPVIALRIRGKLADVQVTRG